MQENFWDFSDCFEKLCKDVVLNKKLITKLQESRFDVILSDAIGACGRPVTLSDLMGKAELWLIRTYWDFESVCPFLPCFEIVIRRFDGRKPDTLGPNTLLFKCIPQNDLHDHPKAKAFITHGGTNNIYEDIYHGIPIVGITLFVDQPGNIVHVKDKGTVRLDFNTIYKDNAMKLSRIPHDQPLMPLDPAVFWIKFVTHHKGAKHLRPASHDLTLFQCRSLDELGYLLASVSTARFVITKCCLLCCQKFAKT
ncbi:hypothetical protein HPG69_001440 [Diceros bicornis minor]|uniref:glucuronosyltransferase n=1 Tax=Diceros bicornis minor TaxID=77932 RepID=A0A7J7FFK0_DICBM|nr:hypothetical protein HPG69_001440 [Diceros bicornis minor]